MRRRNAGSEEGESWIRRCSEAVLLLGDSLFVPRLCEVVVTLFNENNLPLLARGEDTQAFSRLTNTGVDLETDMIYHMWETDLYSCTIPMAWWQTLEMLQFMLLHGCGSSSSLHQNHCSVSRKRGIVARLSNPSSGLGSSCWLQRLGKEAGRWHPCHVNACSLN